MQQVTEKPFGKLSDGTDVKFFTITNGKMTVGLTDYGARIVSVETPDKEGKHANVVLGFDSAEKYEKHTAFFGCTTGRFANRIAKGKFSLDGKEYTLATNNGPNHLHGGKKGLDKYVWKSRIIDPSQDRGVEFTLRSPDGDEGYPGNLDLVVQYTLSDNNELTIHYKATTDKPTVLNLTNHAYWNLAGGGSIVDHVLQVNAEKYVEPSAELIPTGKLAPVEGTPLDFRKPMAMGARIQKLKEMGPPPGGYDHCYALDAAGDNTKPSVIVSEPKSGRTLTIMTTEPGVQFYTGNFLDGDKNNGGHAQHGAFCLETQHYPDSPNQPNFPSTVLRPGSEYRQVTIHRFGVNK